MATLRFSSSTNRKVFTAISSALGALSNGAGTILVLTRKNGGTVADFAGLTDSTRSSFYHCFGHNSAAAQVRLWDDDQAVVLNSVNENVDTTNWYMYAVDWPTGTSQTERFHIRNQTGSGAGSPGSWSHSNALGANTGQRSGPGTGGWWAIGDFNDLGAGQHDHAVVAVWNTRFADGDYGDFRKTSDLYKHSAGPPIFLCELTATTLVDLMGGSTYSSANSSGTTLTGADPDNWTMDGLGSSGVVRTFNPIPFMK